MYRKIPLKSMIQNRYFRMSYYFELLHLYSRRYTAPWIFLQQNTSLLSSGNYEYPVLLLDRRSTNTCLCENLAAL
jgi:hypothetical protein